MLHNHFYTQFAVANFCIFTVSWLLENGWGFSYETKKVSDMKKQK